MLFISSAFEDAYGNKVKGKRTIRLDQFKQFWSAGMTYVKPIVVVPRKGLGKQIACGLNIMMLVPYQRWYMGNESKKSQQLSSPY